jgi:RHS repeat-associated protein
MDAGEMPRTMRCQRHSRATSIGRIPRPCLIHTWYDNLGDMLTAADDNSSYTFTYNVLGQQTSADNNGSGPSGVTGTRGVPDVLLTASYDTLGDRTALDATVGPSGSGTADFQNAYAFDSFGNETQVTQSGETGGNAVADKLVNFTYTANNQVDTIDRYSDLNATSLVATSAYGYDDLGRVTSLNQGNTSSGTAYAGYTWTYDADSQVKTFANSQYSTEDSNYTYDNDGQLTTAAPPSGTSSTASNSLANAYDANGNATTLDGATATITTNNQLQSDGTYDYYYDNNGNIVRQVTIATGAEIDNVYDVRDRLTSVTNKDSSGRITQVVNYSYDMFGDLIGRSLTVNTYTGASTTPTTSTTTTGHFVFDVATGGLVLEFDGGGNLTGRVLNGPAADQVLATESVSSLTTAGSVEWLLPDNENTTRDIVDNNGALQDHLTYNAFGALTSQAGPAVAAATDLIFGGYTGAFYDSATGLSYHNDPKSGTIGRWYNAATQRWLTQDPIFPLSGPNPYEYCDNATTNSCDPTGLADTNAAQPLVLLIRNPDVPSTSGQGHVSILVVDPVTGAGVVYDGVGPHQGDLNALLGTTFAKSPMPTRETLTKEEVLKRFGSQLAAAGYYGGEGGAGFHPGIGRSQYDALLKRYGAGHTGTQVTEVPVVSGSYAGVVGMMDHARSITPQIPYYKATGPNSNTYAHQLILNSGLTDVYPPDGAAGYNYNYNQGDCTYAPPGYMDRGDKGYPQPTRPVQPPGTATLVGRPLN